jgi:drug/metabolite transporter (DMT)-like permease
VLFMGERMTSGMLVGGAMVMLAAVFLARQGRVDGAVEPVRGSAVGNQ